jgi:hypothetical protein
MDSYKTAMIQSVDIHIMEHPNPTLDRDSFLNMVARTLKTKMENTWRVRFHDDGTVAVYSFAIPPHEKILPSDNRLNDVSLLPQWIRERLAVLQICEQGTILEGVGQKVSERVYYVIE